MAVVVGLQTRERHHAPGLVRILRLRAFDQVTNLAAASLQTEENINDAITNLTVNAPVVRVD